MRASARLGPGGTVTRWEPVPSLPFKVFTKAVSFSVFTSWGREDHSAVLPRAPHSLPSVLDCGLSRGAGCPLRKHCSLPITNPCPHPILTHLFPKIDNVNIYFLLLEAFSQFHQLGRRGES